LFAGCCLGAVCAAPELIGRGRPSPSGQEKHVKNIFRAVVFRFEPFNRNSNKMVVSLRRGEPLEHTGEKEGWKAGRRSNFCS
jgi:hypothetical protein